MKKMMNFRLAFLGFLLLPWLMSSCSTAQMGHAEWDDAYFNSTDKARIAYARQASGSQGTTYPNRMNNNGSINNYPDAPQGNNNFNENYSQNPNSNDAAAAYVNPNYQASGRVVESGYNTSQTTTSGGTTYITNNYYDTDNYYRSNRSFFMPSPVMGFGMGPGFSIGIGYSSRWGWFGPSMGFSYGWGWPYNRGWGFYDPFWGFGGMGMGMGWGMGYGMGWGMNPWGCYSVFDPFWGFGFNPMFYDPYWAWRRSYYSPFYGNGGWYGNQVSNNDRSNPAPARTNNRSQMGGNFNPNQVSNPSTASGNYVPPSTGGRSRGERSEPGGLPPVNPAPGNAPNTNEAPATPRGGQDMNATVRPTPTDNTPMTPRQYQPSTTPESYQNAPNRDPYVRPVDPTNRNVNPSPQRGAERFGSGNTPSYAPEPTNPYPSNNPSRTYNPQPSNPNPTRGNNDGFQVPRQQDNGGWFRNNRGSSGGSSGFGGGTSPGGGNRGGSSGGGFTPPPSGGRKRGQ